MSNLEEKFEALEDILATQHTAIGAALDSILTALGEPPLGDTTTLSDIATGLSGLLDELTGIRSDNSTFHAALLDTAGIINTNVETILNNNSLNAQRMIAAIYATSCPCTTDAPLLAPPIDVTPTSLADEAKCRRIQFYLSVFGDWLSKIANYGSATGFVTGAVLDTLLVNAITTAGIVATGAEVGAAAGPPGIVIGAVLSLILLAISVYGGAELVNYANEFNATTMQSNLLAAMYAATNADEGYTAFKTTLLAGMSTIPAEIIYTLWWTAWSNDIYSGTPEVDDSAFDGTICAPEAECVTFESHFESAYGGQHVITIPISYDGWYWSLASSGNVDHYFGAGGTDGTSGNGSTGALAGVGNVDANSGTSDNTYQFWAHSGTTWPITVIVCPTPFV
jgi:hypothetical protein